jgi:hypothetical protein
MDRDDPQYSCIVTLVRPRASSEEELADTIAGSQALAELRAGLLERDTEPADLVYALWLVCWWPFKPASSSRTQQFLAEIVPSLFQGARYGEVPPTRFLEVISPFVLTLDFNQLTSLQQADDFARYFLGRGQGGVAD